ncbi:MAG: HAMP domain-containing sensor histidine kinase [Symbiobacteriia bacterium]
MNQLLRGLHTLAAIPSLLAAGLLVGGLYYLFVPGRVLIFRLLGLALVGLAALLWARIRGAYRATGDLRERLGEMRHVAQQVGQGMVGEKIYTRADDELGLLGADLNDMLKRLRQRLETLQAEKARADAALSNLADAVLLVSPRLRVVYANPAAYRVLDLTNRVLEGRFLLEVLSHSELELKVSRALAQRETSRLEVRRGTRDESVLDVQVAPVLDGTEAGALLVLRDVTRERKLERARAEFVANASHELQTPLTAIRGFAETLLDGALADPTAAHHFIEIIERESTRLAALVDELLDLSSIESGREPVAKAAFDLTALGTEVITHLEARLQNKSLTLTRQFPPGLPHALADRAQIARVLVNLLDNAIKYTPAGGHITMGATDEGTHLAAFVSDSGIGIPEEDQERIFERFYRVDKARSRDSGGTGLGLSIVKHLVERNGGSVSVESRVGAGAHFEFTLPKFR